MLWLNNSVRVALFTESYLPVVNGVSTSVHTLGGELAALGHNPVVVSPHYPGFQDTEDIFPVRRLPSWRTPLNPKNPFAYPPVGGIPTVLRGMEFDIIHTQHPFGIGLQGARLAERLHIPLISTFHTLYMEYGHYVPFLPRQLVVSLVSRYLSWYYAKCSAVIVPSREAGRRLEMIGVNPAKLHVIPTGVPDALPVSREAMEETRQDFDLPVGAPIVLFVGRLAKEKNLELLMESFAALQDGDGKSLKPLLVLVGDGPYRAACEQLIEHYQIEESVRMTGFLSQVELAPLYAMATVFAFPSSSETQGVVLCEAQSHGLPCVVAEGGGAPEFVRNGVDALVVPPTVREFTRSLKLLLTDVNKRREFSNAAFHTPLRLTPSQVGREVVRVYEQVLKKEKSRAA